MALNGRPSRYDTEIVYRATISARNKFTLAFAHQWTDAEIRVLALFKSYLMRNEVFSLSGEAAAHACLISRRSWVTIIQQLEEQGYIEVFRQRITLPFARGKTRVRNLVNCYSATQKLRKWFKNAETQVRHVVTPKRKSVSKPAVKSSKNFAPTCANSSHQYRLYNKQKDILPTTDRRAAPPPEKGRELSVRVAGIEAKLVALRPLAHEALPNNEPLTDEDITRNRHFWESLALMDMKLARDMAAGRFGLVDGLAVIVKRNMRGFGFNRLIDSLERYGLSAALMVVSVAFKCWAGVETIRSPAAYLFGALNNPNGSHPLLSLSHHVWACLRVSEGEIGKRCRTIIAKAWAERLPEQKRKRLYREHESGDSPREHFAKDINDPVWMIRAYQEHHHCQWDILPLLAD